MPGQCYDHTELVACDHTAGVVVADPAVQVTVEAAHDVQLAVQVGVQDGCVLPDDLEIVGADPEEADLEDADLVVHGR